MANIKGKISIEFMTQGDPKVSIEGDVDMLDIQNGVYHMRTYYQLSYIPSKRDVELKNIANNPNLVVEARKKIEEKAALDKKNEQDRKDAAAAKLKKEKEEEFKRHQDQVIRENKELELERRKKSERIAGVPGKDLVAMTEEFDKKNVDAKKIEVITDKK